MRGADFHWFPDPEGGRSVHPRMRGDDGRKRGAIVVYGSVHPRMRGADAEDCKDFGNMYRFIPACAGLIASGPRGELLDNGSSPHTRG